MSKRDLSPDSLEAQADALLAAADSMDIPDEIPMPGKSSRSGKAAKAARPEADHIMTDEEAKKAGIVRLAQRFSADRPDVHVQSAAYILLSQQRKEGQSSIDEFHFILGPGMSVRLPFPFWNCVFLPVPTLLAGFPADGLTDVGAGCRSGCRQGCFVWPVSLLWRRALFSCLCTLKTC